MDQCIDQCIDGLIDQMIYELMDQGVLRSSPPQDGCNCKSDATLAITSKAPENEEGDLSDRFVSKNKEKELD